jgi:hypothetical protein
MSKYRERINCGGGTPSERNDLLMPIYDWQQVYRLRSQVPGTSPQDLKVCQLFDAKMLQY